MVFGGAGGAETIGQGISQNEWVLGSFGGNGGVQIAGEENEMGFLFGEVRGAYILGDILGVLSFPVLHGPCRGESERAEAEWQPVESLEVTSSWASWSTLPPIKAC